MSQFLVPVSILILIILVNSFVADPIYTTPVLEISNPVTDLSKKSSIDLVNREDHGDVSHENQLSNDQQHQTNSKDFEYYSTDSDSGSETD
ncbi:Nose resistant to fluoxetine protein 6 [Sarcoptes scabiei]|uniref:Secreted protein n=1 Tax=Sarcoptes scabiei TaxID=52283 RepID=A0A132A2I2_SARSC|nr:hypothetical protein QR98_0037030 [Sarcoptes scabiei]UXI17714.1 Nose resistant to fluoxetine protein 6 [Sarcoptes scabiei]